jgi:hypothetical protein
MKPLDILKQLSIEEKKRNNPAFPVEYLPVTKYSDRTANGLTRCIKDFLNLSGHQAERINTMGTFIKGKIKNHGHLGTEINEGRYIPTTGTKGSADLSSIIKVNVEGVGVVGLTVKIEVKIGKDRQSDEQKKYEQDVIAAGGKYWICKSFDEFYNKYLELTNGK